MNIKHYLILCVCKYPTQPNKQQSLRRKAKQCEMKKCHCVLYNIKGEKMPQLLDDRMVIKKDILITASQNPRKIGNAN